jgi:hypothetical protein
MPPPPQPDCAERLGNRVINVEGTRVVVPGSRACALAVTPSPLLPRPPSAAMPQSGPSLLDASPALAAVTTATSSIAANKWKRWNQAYYLKKMLCLLNF